MAFEESGNLRGRPLFLFKGTPYNSGVDFAARELLGVNSSGGRLRTRFVDGVLVAIFLSPPARFVGTFLQGPRFLFTGAAELSEPKTSM